METEQRPTAGDNEAAIIGTQLWLAASMNGAAAGRALATPEVANREKGDFVPGYLRNIFKTKHTPSPSS
jgi:hypothetical protein